MKFSNLKPLKEGTSGILDGSGAVVIHTGYDEPIWLEDCENIVVKHWYILGYRYLGWKDQPLLKFLMWWILRIVKGGKK